MNSIKDNILAFLTGDIFAFVFTWGMLEKLGFNIFAAILTGFFGGVAGILGKLFVEWIKSKF